MRTSQRNNDTLHRKGKTADAPEALRKDGELRPLRPIREVAAELGIGRSRVVQLEQQALDKLRRLLAKSGIRFCSEFTEKDLDPGLAVGEDMARRSASFAGLWLSIDRIVSVNGGSTDTEDVARAFRFLRQITDKCVRPPVFGASDHGFEQLYHVLGIAQFGNAIKVRCMPARKDAPRPSVAAKLNALAVVESIFDRDERGEFDVPILVCVILSLTPRHREARHAE